MAMTTDVATEHIKDGSDCISEALKAIRRVKKDFPNTGNHLNKVEAHLSVARDLLKNPAAVLAETQPK